MEGTAAGNTGRGTITNSHFTHSRDAGGASATETPERASLRRAQEHVLAGQHAALGRALNKTPELLQQVDELGRTLLHCAAAHGQTDCIDVLLSKGALTTVKDKESGWTPLHAALYAGQLRVALQLLQHRCSTTAVTALNGVEDFEGYTPLDLLSLQRRGRPAKGGDVHCCGAGSNFQLGNAGGDAKLPRRLAALRGIAVAQVSTSSRHTLFLTDYGEIYAAGHGPGGRLGTGHEHTQPTPVPVPKLRHVSFVCAGPSGSAAISGDGNLFMWGRSELGITPHDDGKSQPRGQSKPQLDPKRVEAMRKHRVRQVCLEDKYVAVLTSDGLLYTAGDNTHGQLCSESRDTSENHSNASELRRVSALADVRLRSVCTAPKGGIALLEGDTDYVYEWGWSSGFPRKVGIVPKKTKQQPHFHRSHKLSIASASVGAVVLVATASGEVHSWYPGGGEPTRLQLFREKKVKVVAACDDSCLVVTDCGDLYRWKAKEYTPIPAPKSATRIQSSPSSSPVISAARAPRSPSLTSSPSSSLQLPAAVVDGSGVSSLISARPPKVSSHPKLQREQTLKQVTAVSNSGTHYHVITPLRMSANQTAEPPAKSARRVHEDEQLTTASTAGVVWATYLEGVGDSPYAGDLNKALEIAFQSGKSRHSFKASFDGGPAQKYTMQFSPLQTDTGEKAFVQTNDAYGTTRPVSRLLNGEYSLKAAPKPFQRRQFGQLGVKTLKELCQLSAAANVTYETLLGTYAFALGYEADTLGDQCADTALHNLESVLIGVTDRSAVSPEYEEYLFDIFEALELHMQGQEEMLVDDDNGNGSVAHDEQIAELQRKIEQAYENHELLSALVQGGDTDVDPMQVFSLQQEIEEMHEQLDQLRTIAQAAAAARPKSARPAFRYKLDPALISGKDGPTDIMGEHATQLRKRVRTVRKKLAQITVLEQKEGKGEELTVEQARKIADKYELLEQERSLVEEAESLKIELPSAQPPDESLPAAVGPELVGTPVLKAELPRNIPTPSSLRDTAQLDGDSVASEVAAAPTAATTSIDPTDAVSGAPPRTALFMLQQSRGAELSYEERDSNAGGGSGKKGKKKSGKKGKEKQLLWSSGPVTAEADDKEFQRDLHVAMERSQTTLPAAKHSIPKPAWGRPTSTQGESAGKAVTATAASFPAKQPLTLAGALEKSKSAPAAASSFLEIQNAQKQSTSPTQQRVNVARPSPGGSPRGTSALPAASSPHTESSAARSAVATAPKLSLAELLPRTTLTRASTAPSPVKGWGSSPEQNPAASSSVHARGTRGAGNGAPKLTLEALQAQARARTENKRSAPSLLDIQNEQRGSSAATGGVGGLGWAAVAAPSNRSSLHNGNTSCWNYSNVGQNEAEKTSLAAIQCDPGNAAAETEQVKKDGGSGLFWDEEEDGDQADSGADRSGQNATKHKDKDKNRGGKPVSRRESPDHASAGEVGNGKKPSSKGKDAGAATDKKTPRERKKGKPRPTDGHGRGTGRARGTGFDSYGRGRGSGRGRGGNAKGVRNSQSERTGQQRPATGEQARGQPTEAQMPRQVQTNREAAATLRAAAVDWKPNAAAAEWTPGS